MGITLGINTDPTAKDQPTLSQRLMLSSDAGKALVLRAIKNHKEETSTRTVSEISTKTDVKSMPSTDPMDPTMDQEISTTLVPSIMDQEISTTLPSMDPMDPLMDKDLSTTLVPSMDPTMDQEISTTLPSM